MHAEPEVRSTAPRMSRGLIPNASAWARRRWVSCCPCDLAYEPPDVGPPSIVAKLAAALELEQPWPGRLSGREWRFYRDLAGSVPPVTPRYPGGAISEDDRLAATLLEDLGDRAGAGRGGRRYPRKASRGVLALGAAGLVTDGQRGGNAVARDVRRDAMAGAPCSLWPCRTSRVGWRGPVLGRETRRWGE